MSKVKNGGLDQYDAEPLKQQQFGTSGVEGVNRAVNLQFTGPGFESWLGNTAQWPWTSYLHLCASVIKQYNLVPAKGQ